MKKVMVIDDSKTVRNYHGSILSEYGAEVIEAENGMEALEKSVDGDISMFVVDVNMPVMDGYSFVKEIRKKEGYSLTPIIMITTQLRDIDKVEAYSAGANLFKVKPIKPELLTNVTKILLS